jgi:hypothetical protein
MVLSGLVRCFFEEELGRHLQYLGDMLQATCADAVRALFIFLHLLECQTERIAEFHLGHTKHQAAHADALAWLFTGLF